MTLILTQFNSHSFIDLPTLKLVVPLLSLSILFGILFRFAFYYYQSHSLVKFAIQESFYSTYNQKFQGPLGLKEFYEIEDIVLALRFEMGYDYTFLVQRNHPKDWWESF